MNRQLSRLDFLFAARIRNEAFGQFRTLTVGNHPAHHITAEDVEDHVEIKIGPLRRAEQFRDIPAPELVGSGGQQFRFGVSRMRELVAALTRLARAFQNPVHGANRAMIKALVEQRGVNRRRRAVLKSLLMKAGQDHFPFRANQRTRHVPHGGSRRRKKIQTPLPIKRSARKVESLAGGSDSDHRRKIPDGRSHDTSVSAIGMPSSIATFF